MRVFNKYIDWLEKLKPAEWPTHLILPSCLPTELHELQKDEMLTQDIWISESTEPPPSWLVDPDMKDGIRAMHD